MKKYSVRRALCCVCSITLVLLLVWQPVYASGSVRNDSSYFVRLMDFIQDQYYDEVSDDALLEGAVRGMFGSLDEYSSFMNRNERNEFYSTITGSFGGIGATMQQSDEYIVVVNVYRGSPADKAGIFQGDIIVEADGTSLVGVSVNDAADIIRGQPGTKVRLGLIRNGDTIYIDVVREIIKVNPVIYESRNGIGYIKLELFNSNADEYITEALKYFDKIGISRIVLDLRNNPGGDVAQAVSLAEKFVPAGPIAVLVNGSSASASEIVAGAVQDRGAGKLVGTKTFGKAKVQTAVPILTPAAYFKYKQLFGLDTVNVYDLYNNGVVPGQDEIYGYAQMTVGLYYTPAGKMIDGIGITPDIQADDPEYINGVDITNVQKLSKTNVFKQGSKGNDIFNAKLILRLLGYGIDNVDINFDEELESALKEYQSEKKINTNGILDVKTQTLLNVDLNELIMKYDGQYAAAVKYLKS